MPRTANSINMAVGSEVGILGRNGGGGGGSLNIMCTIWCYMPMTAYFLLGTAVKSL